MKTKLILIAVPMLFGAPALLAAEGNEAMEVSGSIGLDVLYLNEGGETVDAAKLNEYRDLSTDWSDFTGGGAHFELKGRGSDHYFDAFGENINRDDQYLDLKGGSYTRYKYQLYQNKIIHNWAFDALTPYNGVGTDTLTAPLPFNVDPATWNPYDLSQQREDIGGMFELSNNSPWYVRVDANQVTDEGLKLIAGSNGTSPGNGFIDKPFQIDTKTQNFAVEGGYASTKGQLSVSAMYSKFSNENDLLRWTNPYFNGLDTTTLAADSDYYKIGVNGVLKQLPVDSTLAGRLTYSKTSNDIPILTNILSTASANPATNPDQPTFDGDVAHTTASLSLHSNFSKALDSRVYWNYFKKDNDSPHITFSGLTGTGLDCGGGVCTTETLSYDKNNGGLDFGYRINPDNRLILGYDYLHLERDRIDFDDTVDHKASVEYRNTSLDALSARFKYQYLQRRSNFLEANAGTGPADPEYLNRYVARFDASNVDQNLVKLVLDATPAKHLDLGLEAIYKKNDFRDTVLGRTADEREELYLSVGYGDIRKLRVMVFADAEFVQYDSYHRNISTLAAVDAYDPYAPPTNTNYNWAATNEDESYSVGLGLDWVPAERWKTNASFIWQRTEGVVDFAVQPGAVPAVPAVPINASDNTEKWSLNLKGIYQLTKAWELTGGYSYEKYRFDDIAYDGYRYVIPGSTVPANSYLSGASAFPDYTVHIVYLSGTFKF